MDWEFAFLDWIQETLRCTFLDWFMPLITKLGNAGIFWILVTLVMFAYKPSRKCAFISSSALLMGLFIGNLLLKPLVARIRPYDVNTAVTLLIPAPMERYSFPSGHAQASFASATSIFICEKRFGIPALILAVIIAFSRMYLYVHYPTDILAGMVFGITYACVSYVIVNKLYDKKQKQQ